MQVLPFARRTLLGLAGTVLGAAVITVTAQGSELPVAGAARSLTIHGPEETLRDFCVEQDGALWLCLPGGARYELITSTSDAAVANAGDGSFHPFEEAQVRSALAALSYPLDGICADVFLLPYPRRGGLESAAGPELILLSPGVLPLTAAHQQAEFTHELGHVVQYARMPDGDTNAWADYRKLRGIVDATVYNASAPHADRPHEIFAEDFRALFGGSVANYSGTIENADLPLPTSVSGLADFMRALEGGSGIAMSRSLTGFPNPSRGVMSFTRSGGAPAPLDLFDVSGRRVATIAPDVTVSGVLWSWDGRGLAGEAIGAGVFFARVRDGNRATLRVTRVR